MRKTLSGLLFSAIFLLSLQGSADQKNLQYTSVFLGQFKLVNRTDAGCQFDARLNFILMGSFKKIKGLKASSKMCDSIMAFKNARCDASFCGDTVMIFGVNESREIKLFGKEDGPYAFE